MALQVSNIDRPLGAVITGVDLTQPLDDQTLSAIRRILDDRAVAVFKHQNLRPEHQTGFASRFGKLLVHAHSKNIRQDNPGLSIISNIQVEGKNIGVPDAGLVWHTDGSYLERPDGFTFLYGIEIPISDGKALGNTLYSSTTAAYDALSAAMKERLAPLKAVHSLEYHSINRAAAGGTKVVITDELRKKVPDREHPVIRTHPRTGRKTIFVSEGHTSRIVGMDPAESKKLLWELFEHMRKPEFLYSHSWEKGDFVVWDNAATQHRATADYKLPLRRLMNRAATEGEPVF